ncbi:adenine phosphoribosyltransferase [Helicobacter apodemus]|uniref:Adenine phosphoribosyltransferase n=1 Tax=Helicobacter apodemus TaxID=135569 RepID=A0A2U8FFS4_9HELI|nr:adenine phosphoribosyltransferase [Helicobacter apodemus]AWI34888.1 adenine phosphoribosyltransferase [Helicobacter apodemus]
MQLTTTQQEFLLQTIRSIKDFPQPGINFRDITTLLSNKEAFTLLINHLKSYYQSYEIDYIAGIESRGFIFGAALAYALNVGFIPIRKKGKLPYTTISEKYSLEYGFNEIEIHIDAFKNEILNHIPKVLLIDDLLATGGTAYAAANLIKKAGANCIEACFIIHLKDLKGEENLQNLCPIYNVLSL